MFDFRIYNIGTQFKILFYLSLKNKLYTYFLFILIYLLDCLQYIAAVVKNKPKTFGFILFP